MRKCAACVILIFPSVLFAAESERVTEFFISLKALEFERARRFAEMEKDSMMRSELLQLTEILFFAGQRNSSDFIGARQEVVPGNDGSTLDFVRLMSAGYYSLFYDQLKGNAYRDFYKAYALARAGSNPVMVKFCILAILRYYNQELVQNSHFYQPYLEQLEELKSDKIDDVWLDIYRMIFYSKTLQKLDEQYFILAAKLDEHESTLPGDSPLLTQLYFEKALKFDIQADGVNARKYYQRAIEQARDYPFQRRDRFFAYIRLMLIEMNGRNFPAAEHLYDKAREQFNIADSLRTNYYLSMYGARLLNAERGYDSAFALLERAFIEDFRLDFRMNSLEINRLNVELETQEKEIANLRLRQNRIWLSAALGGVGLLFLASYLAFTNQRAKNRMQLQEQQVQRMKLEKVLRDQELFGIDSMLEGQEKERQRIAQELHDNLGSLLATIKLHIYSVRSPRHTAEQRDSMIQKTEDLVEEAYQKVRGFAHLRNSGVNAQEGLLPAVNLFASKASVIHNLQVEVKDHGMDNRLENSLEIAVFRVIQELITNIIKHAGASVAVIHLTQHEDMINLMVEDNGIGFDIRMIKPSHGMGLHSIQKRIEGMGGRVTIDSIREKGTTVIIDIPII
jgi:signal transduction histidine kinase